ncbi:MAG: SAM-dependent methyltransferase [Burkholderiales bacterium]|nr:SAM-dependent methyltransferase [Burkholderiales bacterium]
MKTGTLYLIPTNLSAPFTPAHILPATVVETALRLNHYVAENAKVARAFLKNIGLDKPLLEISIRELNNHTRIDALAEMIAPLVAGHDVGLVSEAGAPGVADPGAIIVALAHQHGIAVVPLVGPSSILLGLMASGLNGQKFAFHGYLPQDKAIRINVLIELENESRRRNMTQLFIETPYRNHSLYADLLTTLSPSTQLCVARDLTGNREYVQTKRIAEWRKLVPTTEKLPTLFLLLAK